MEQVIVQALEQCRSKIKESGGDMSKVALIENEELGKSTVLRRLKMDELTKQQVKKVDWQFPSRDEPIGLRQSEQLPSNKAQSFRKEYMDKAELMLLQRFGNLEGVQQAVDEGRIEAQIPEYLADWCERIVIDGRIMAELKHTSYFVLS